MWLDDLNKMGKLPIKWTLRFVEICAETATKYWGIYFLAIVFMVFFCYFLASIQSFLQWIAR